MKSLLPIILFLFLISCGGRLPSPKTAHKVITKHFVKYAKKYPTSVFGLNELEKVAIFEVREIQKNIAEIDAYIHLFNKPIYPVRVTLEKKPYGWKSVAWENLREP